MCLCVSAAIKEKYKDWTEFLVQDLTGSRTAPANLLEGVSLSTEANLAGDNTDRVSLDVVGV